MTDSSRLARLLGDPELSWLLARVRRRMSRGQPLAGTVTLSDATHAQRAAAHRLLGRAPRPGNTLTVSLAQVDDVLRRSGACPGGLAAAIVTLTGAVSDRAAEAKQLRRRWDEAYAPLQTLQPELVPWRDRVLATGLVRRLTEDPESAFTVVTSLMTVLARLPVQDEQLGRFAARVLGNAHALDADQPLTTLLLGAIRAKSDLPEGAGAEWRREVWASVGLLSDELSSTALVVGLPGDPRTSTGRVLDASRDAGQPVVLTLRQLRRDPPELSVPHVFVCENPAVVSEAADRLGRDCAPLVCTNGQPGVAVLQLLRQLAAGGAQIHYHGDFDWGGLRIGNVVFGRLPVQPWHFRTADYLATQPTDTALARVLAGSGAEAHWDAELGSAMRAAGVAVEEEHVLHILLPDLAP